jgi:anti-sigma factor RsiW
MTSNHAVDREEVMAFVDGELDAKRAVEVGAHIKGCSECRALVETFRRVSSGLQAWPVEVPPAALRLREPGARRTWWKGGGRLGLPRWVIVAVPAAAGVVLVVLATSQGASRARMSPPIAKQTEDQPVADAPGGRVFTGAQPRPLREKGQGQQGQAGAGPVVQLQTLDPADGPMVARAVSLSIVTDRFADVRAALERITADMRGMVGSLNMTGDPPTRRSLHATLRVPAARLDAALVEVRKLGQVRQESQSSEDVSDAHRDLVVRISNATKEEARLNDLLVNRTGRLQDVLAVEREVTRVRGEIEQMKAQELAMRNRVTYATISVEITEAYKAEVSLGPLPIGTQLRNAIVDGWRSAANSAFAIVLFVFEAGPSVLLWMLVLGPPAWFVWRRARRTV